MESRNCVAISRAHSKGTSVGPHDELSHDWFAWRDRRHALVLARALSRRAAARSQTRSTTTEPSVALGDELADAWFR